MSDFEGELSIEPIIGVRVFMVDDMGRLRGVTHHDVWRPGENVSVCHAFQPEVYEYDEAGYLAAVRKYQTAWAKWNGARVTMNRRSWRGQAQSCGDEPAMPERDNFRRELGNAPKHSREYCQCGFWAYYTPQTDYKRPEYVYGVIKGYGEVTIGSKGFRAEKAEVLAVSLPPTEEEWVGYRHSLVRRNYPNVPTFDSLAAMLAEVTPSRHHAPTDDGFWDTPEKPTDDRLALKISQAMLSFPNIPARYLTGGGWS